MARSRLSRSSWAKARLLCSVTFSLVNCTCASSSSRFFTSSCKSPSHRRTLQWVQADGETNLWKHQDASHASLAENWLFGEPAGLDIAWVGHRRCVRCGVCCCACAATLTRLQMNVHPCGEVVETSADAVYRMAQSASDSLGLWIRFPLWGVFVPAGDCSAFRTGWLVLSETRVALPNNKATAAASSRLPLRKFGMRYQSPP